MFSKNLVLGMTIMTALIFVGSIVILTLQQQAYALRGRALAQLRTMIGTTSHFVKDVSKLFIPPYPIAPFVTLTNQFEKNVIKAVYAGDTPPNLNIPNLVQKYRNDVINLHLPDSVVRLLETYKLDVLNIFTPVT